jgi:hypothetical protein
MSDGQEKNERLDKKNAQRVKTRRFIQQPTNLWIDIIRIIRVGRLWFCAFVTHRVLCREVDE